MNGVQVTNAQVVTRSWEGNRKGVKGRRKGGKARNEQVSLGVENETEETMEKELRTNGENRRMEGRMAK